MIDKGIRTKTVLSDEFRRCWSRSDNIIYIDPKTFLFETKSCLLFKNKIKVGNTTLFQI